MWGSLWMSYQVDHGLQENEDLMKWGAVSCQSWNPSLGSLEQGEPACHSSQGAFAPTAMFTITKLNSPWVCDMPQRCHPAWERFLCRYCWMNVFKVFFTLGCCTLVAMVQAPVDRAFVSCAFVLYIYNVLRLLIFHGLPLAVRLQLT